MENVFRLWKPVAFERTWLECDTSILDDISASWFERRKELTDDSREFSDFLTRLKREHAIETGIVERLYDLKKGITETFINEGFVRSFLSHGDTDIPAEDLMSHLNDHLDSVNFVFDIVKEDRPLFVSFIKQLHQLVTRNQYSAEGRDQFGTKLQIELLKGTFKIRENNPTREDGTRILYCPPEQVDSEMDNLISLYNESTVADVHPLIVATWFHHAFTTIHPFQDGNGRVARLLTSLIFIKSGFFPFTVLREEAKVKYIEALEKSDNEICQPLISYFAEVQNRNIQRALNIKEVTSTSLVEVQDIFVQKIENWKNQRAIEHKELLANSRNAVFDYCNLVLNEQMKTLREKLHGNAEVSIASCSFKKQKNQHFFYSQIISYAKKYDYLFNRMFPKAWIMFKIDINEKIKYQLGISIHHYGYDDSTLAIGSFLDSKSSKRDEKIDTTLPLEIPPHVISIFDDIEAKKKNIKRYLDNALTLALAQIANEI